MAKPNFQFEKRQKEPEKKRRNEEKLRRKQEKKAAGVVDDGEQDGAEAQGAGDVSANAPTDAPTAAPGSNDVAPSGQ